MIVIDKAQQRFNYRIAGVVIQNGSVLVHQAEGDNFWILPGGRAEIGESAEQTLKREMVEELGAEVEILRPLWFVENFFSYDGKDFHEVAIYFLMRLPEPSPILDSDGPYIGFDKGTRLIFQWISADPLSLASLPLLPSFLQSAVEDLPESMQHIVHND